MTQIPEGDKLFTAADDSSDSFSRLFEFPVFCNFLALKVSESNIWRKVIAHATVNKRKRLFELLQTQFISCIIIN